MKTVEKVWGKEEWIVNNDLYCFKKLHLTKGYHCSMHHHKIKDETFIVQEGRVFLNYDETFIVLFPGDTFHVPPNMEHQFLGLEDSVIYEVSTTHMDEDSYRSSPSGKIEQ